MKIFICCSKHFYGKVPSIKEALEKAGHTVMLPNSYDEPLKEIELKSKSAEEHRRWKVSMLRQQSEKIAQNDAIFVINMEKNGQANYIGGATFLEIAKAFDLSKKVFMINPIPEGIFADELSAMSPLIVGNNFSLVK